MAVTIQQIAEKAGVSRGTVDRALHHRGRINPQVAEKIWELADEMGYVPKERKKKENSRKKIKIGVVTQLARASFMLEINRGIRMAAIELADRGIQLILKEGIHVDEEEQLTAVRELLEEGIQGLAIMPVDCEGVRTELNRLTDEEQIPVVTFNSDIVGTRRRCFVGMDNRQSGRTAAGLMGLLTGGRGKVLIITGYFSNDVDNQRVDGFIEEIKKSYPDLEIAGVQGRYFIPLMFLFYLFFALRRPEKEKPSPEQEGVETKGGNLARPRLLWYHLWVSIPAAALAATLWVTVVSRFLL